MPEPAPTPVDELQRRLGYAFRDPAILARALTHPSWIQDNAPGGESNQRLEFLGDAVLQFVVTRTLFSLFPADREGPLTRRRAILTKGSFLVGLAREIGLDGCLRLGAAEEASGGRAKAAALEDAFEALVGAVFLDGDLATAERVVLGLYGDLATRLAGAGEEDNPKGLLQELVQPGHGNQALRYEVVATTGSDHAREYEVAVFLNDRRLGGGRGPSKRIAEEQAAREALAALRKTI